MLTLLLIDPLAILLTNFKHFLDMNRPYRIIKLGATHKSVKFIKKKSYSFPYAKMTKCTVDIYLPYNDKIP